MRDMEHQRQIIDTFVNSVSVSESHFSNTAYQCAIAIRVDRKTIVVADHEVVPTQIRVDRKRDCAYLEPFFSKFFCQLAPISFFWAFHCA